MVLAVAGAALVGCGIERDGRGGGGGLGLGGDDDLPPVTFVEEGQYSPIAQYLVSNADNPVPTDGEPAADAGGAADGDMSCDGFTCGDNSCIPADWKCDALSDCPGGEDEKDCPASPDGTGGAADGGNDGGDGGGQTCDGFACADATCITASWQCDGIVDCSSGEDEANCPSSDDGGDSNDGGDDGGNDGGGSCSGYACNDGTCIEASWQCDQVVDCSAGEDEANCPGSDGGDDGGGGEQCDGFACNDGTCIDNSWVCDTEADCSGGEDEASCARVDPLTPVGGLSGALRPTKGALSCIANWTVAGAGTGALVGEAVTKSCEGAGVVVGVVSGGAGFAAALVCLGADVTQVDSVVGGILGAVTGLVGGVSMCEGDALAEAGSALQTLMSAVSLPVFKVEAKPTTNTKKCGVPVNVDRTGDQNMCESQHSDMKDFESNNPHRCNIDIGNLGNDPTAIAAACAEIRSTFANAIEVADRRYALGKACYQNGNQGPMGNSDFGHQVAWCSARQGAQRCVEQARDAKLNCDLTQVMEQHDLPSGCGNVLACK